MADIILLWMYLLLLYQLGGRGASRRNQLCRIMFAIPCRQCLQKIREESIIAVMVAFRAVTPGSTLFQDIIHSLSAP